MSKINLKPNSLTALGAIAMVGTTLGLSISVVQSQSVKTIAIDGSSTVFPICLSAPDGLEAHPTRKV